MKSLLVDALRKASEQGGSSSVQSTTDDDDSAGTAAPTHSATTPDDEAVILPVLKLDGAPSPAEDSRHPDELALAPEPDADLEQDFLPADTVAVARSPSRSSLLEKSTSRGGSRETSWLYRTARWSPLLYLLALSSAAASYYGYQRLAVAGVSTELGSMPTQLAFTDTADLEPGNAWTALPDSERVSSTASARTTERSPEEPATRGAGRSAEDVPRAVPTGVVDSVLPTLREAYSAYGAADYASAESLYRSVLNARPFHAQALSGLSAALERQGKRDDARSVYERLLKVEPNNAAAAAALVALVDRESASAVGAETQLKLLAQRHPRVAEIRAALGSRHAERQEWAEAYEAYLAAVAMDPARADYHYNAAVCAENLGRLLLAREHYAAALRRSSEPAAFDAAAVAAHLATLGQRGGSRL
ncbi:MAG: tetratricopeptide repeat protein [Pseudomonadota bacterium]